MSRRNWAIGPPEENWNGLAASFSVPCRKLWALKEEEPFFALPRAVFAPFAKEGQPRCNKA